MVTIERRPNAMALVKRLTGTRLVVSAYEACGYEIHRYLTELSCRAATTPALTIIRTRDGVKAHRRDAQRRAQLYRVAELTTIRVAIQTEETAHDQVCAREDRLRARYCFNNFLLRHERVQREISACGSHVS